MHIVVVGAGIIGLTSAHALLEAGHHVTVIDSAGGPASGTSQRNGAQMSYAFVAPLASPATLRALPSMLLDRQSPLRFRPGLSPAIWRWCLRFLLACNSRQALATTRGLLELAELSRQQFTQWRSRHDDAQIHFRRNGKLVLYRDASSWNSARRQLASQAAWGPPQQLCDASRCVDIEPALRADRMPIIGGVLTPDEEVADCELVCRQLLQDMQGHERFEALWHTRALRWETARPRAAALMAEDAEGRGLRLAADAFVVANGIGAPQLLRSLGITLSVAPLKGYSIELPASSLAQCPIHSITDSARKIVFAPLGDGPQRRLRVAGMAELVGHDLRIDAGRIEQLLDATDRCFGLRERPRDIHPWAGLRPATPTGLPVIGAARAWSNVFINAGHGALGQTLSFGAAARLCGLVLRTRDGAVPAPAGSSAHSPRAG